MRQKESRKIIIPTTMAESARLTTEPDFKVQEIDNVAAPTRRSCCRWLAQLQGQPCFHEPEAGEGAVVQMIADDQESDHHQENGAHGSAKGRADCAASQVEET